MSRTLVYFRALRSRNYRLYFIGQMISLIGYWLTRVATNWLVYRITHSVWLLGVVGFASQIPNALILPFAGVWIDRMNKQKLLLITQTCLMIPSFILAYLTFTNQITFWNVVWLSVILGIVQAFDVPGRQSFVVEMVERRHDLSNAIALNSSMFNVARLVGPTLAGLLIAGLGEWICFLVDGISYFAVLGSIAAMKLPPHKPKPEESILNNLKEGFRFAFGFSPIRLMLTMVALTSLFGMSYLVMMPVVAREVLHGGPSTLGFLTGASGVGALSGALFLAGQKNVLSYGKYISISCFAGGLGLVLFSLSNHLIISMFFIVMSSFGFMIQLAGSNSVLQSVVDDDKRGRIMSLYTLAFLGVAPFGSLWVGQMARTTNVLTAIRYGGVICCLAAVWFSFHLKSWYEKLKPLYIKKGILPEVIPEI